MGWKQISVRDEYYAKLEAQAKKNRRSVAGSLVSGFISVYLGFCTTFVLAGVLLFSAVALIARLPKSPSADSGFHQ